MKKLFSLMLVVALFFCPVFNNVKAGAKTHAVKKAKRVVVQYAGTYNGFDIVFDVNDVTHKCVGVEMSVGSTGITIAGYYTGTLTYPYGDLTLSDFEIDYYDGDTLKQLFVTGDFYPIN
ncbi:hypothetical protein ACFGVR_05595 [Mucilaginibacter sp. AW1-3]